MSPEPSPPVSSAAHPPRRKKRANPFYVLLVIVGVVFTITCCAYGVMMVQFLDPQRAHDLRQAGTGLLLFLDRHGLSLLLWELAILGAATLAAIGTDRWWNDETTDE